MYRWPWRRFEAMFQRHLLRKAAEELARQRDLLVAAVNANMNYDSEENRNAREQRLSGIQRSYEEGMNILYSDPKQDDDDPYSMENDPLFDSVRRRARDMRESARPPQLPEAGMGRRLIEA